MELAGGPLWASRWGKIHLCPGQGLLPSLFPEAAGAQEGFFVRAEFAGQPRSSLPRSLPGLLKAQKMICRVSASLEKQDLAPVRSGSTRGGPQLTELPCIVSWLPPCHAGGQVSPLPSTPRSLSPPFLVSKPP